MINGEIHEHGYWNPDTAHQHHVHSPALSKWIGEFLDSRGHVKELDCVLDFGCGLGNYIKDLRDAGFDFAYGVDGLPAKQAVINDIIPFDLSQKITFENKGIFERIPAHGLSNVNVISLEVGEHIPAEFMDNYLYNITQFCDDYLITSWAVRGQDGFGHVNCLDNHEILPHFERRGFKLLDAETQEARAVIEDNCHWFRNTLFVFQKNNK